MMSELEITDEHKQCVSVAIISVPAPCTPVREGDGRQVMRCRVQIYHRLTLCVRRNWILPLAGDVRRDKTILLRMLQCLDESDVRNVEIFALESCDRW